MGLGGGARVSEDRLRGCDAMACDVGKGRNGTRGAVTGRPTLSLLLELHKLCPGMTLATSLSHGYGHGHGQKDWIMVG